MSPALLLLLQTLIPLLIQQVPAAIAAGQQLLAMLESGTSPTEAQIQALTAQISTDETAAQAAISAAS